MANDESEEFRFHESYAKRHGYSALKSPEYRKAYHAKFGVKHKWADEDETFQEWLAAFIAKHGKDTVIPHLLAATGCLSFDMIAPDHSYDARNAFAPEPAIRFASDCTLLLNLMNGRKDVTLTVAAGSQVVPREYWAHWHYQLAGLKALKELYPDCDHFHIFEDADDTRPIGSGQWGDLNLEARAFFATEVWRGSEYSQLALGVRDDSIHGATRLMDMTDDFRPIYKAGSLVEEAAPIEEPMPPKQRDLPEALDQATAQRWANDFIAARGQAAFNALWSGELDDAKVWNALAPVPSKMPRACTIQLEFINSKYVVDFAAKVTQQSLHRASDNIAEGPVNVDVRQAMPPSKPISLNIKAGASVDPDDRLWFWETVAQWRSFMDGCDDTHFAVAHGLSLIGAGQWPLGATAEERAMIAYAIKSKFGFDVRVSFPKNGEELLDTPAESLFHRNAAGAFAYFRREPSEPPPVAKPKKTKRVAVPDRGAMRTLYGIDWL